MEPNQSVDVDLVLITKKRATRIIRANGQVEIVAPKNGVDFKLDEMQAIVGGYIQVVPLKYNMQIVCDEEGKLKGYPVNRLATDVWEDTFGKGTDIIVGDVLICSQTQIR